MLFFVSSFWVCFVFVFCFFVLVSFCSYENHGFPCNSCVFWFIKQGISVSHFSFRFLLFVLLCVLSVSGCSFVSILLLVLLFCFE